MIHTITLDIVLIFIPTSKFVVFRTRIPVSNTVTALEVWLLACMLLVFLSLVEYAVILRQIVLYKRWGHCRLELLTSAK